MQLCREDKTAVEYRWEGPTILPDGSEIFLSGKASLPSEHARSLKHMLVYISDITHQKQTERDLQKVNRELSHYIETLKKRNHEVNIFSQMEDLLQSSRTFDDIYNILSDFAQKLLPDMAGALYLYNHSHNRFGPHDCLGRIAARPPIFF